MAKKEQVLQWDTVDLIELPVKIAGKEYVLKEASGDVAVTYRDALLACTTLGDNFKPSKIEGMASTEALLVSLCLFQVGVEGKQTPVSETVIRSWPNKIIKPLYNKAKEISELDETEEGSDAADDAAKNEQNG